jgi:DUF438 domain-containing protein
MKRNASHVQQGRKQAMSELIDNAQKRRDLLKHMILQLHKGEAAEAVRTQLIRLLGKIPYDEVVLVEQELISEGLPSEEVLELCDIHTAALEGQISQDGAKTAPPGHPVHTFKEENRALLWEIKSLGNLYEEVAKPTDAAELSNVFTRICGRFNALTDVEKHYQRKENLLFPFLEKHGVTGPPAVMWGKHDETRELLKAAIQSLDKAEEMDSDSALTVMDLVLKPASKSIEEMIYKEEEILFPMSLDTLTEDEWYGVYKQSIEIGFCLYDPTDEWKPEKITEEAAKSIESERIQLPSGSMTPDELSAILNTIPFDLTFVDKDDTVRYFTQGRERIFARTRAILGRKVQLCHPPGSVHIVQKIIDDFRSGKQNRAPFWINLKGRFIHIEYFALRDKEGTYLGTLEVSQDLTDKRALEGEQRLLSYMEA